MMFPTSLISPACCIPFIPRGAIFDPVVERKAERRTVRMRAIAIEASIASIAIAIAIGIAIAIAIATGFASRFATSDRPSTTTDEPAPCH